MCHSRDFHRAAARPSAQDALITDPRLRASDDERESAADLLRGHGAAGRLDVDELEQRLGAAYSATTRGDLAALLRDLPGAAPARPRAVAARRDHGFHEWSGFLRVAVLLIAIWALSGAGYFWPAWVLVWWAVALLFKSGPRLLRLR